MELTTLDILALAICLGIVIGIWVAIPGFWRGKRRYHQHVLYRWWTFLSRPGRRGMYRAMLVTAMGSTLMVAAVTLLFATEPVADRWDHVVEPVFAGLLFGGFGIFFVGVPLIVLFNRPRFLVPPDLRHQPGVFQLRRRACRIRRATRQLAGHGRVIERDPARQRLQPRVYAGRRRRVGRDKQ